MHIAHWEDGEFTRSSYYIRIAHQIIVSTFLAFESKAVDLVTTKAATDTGVQLLQRP